MGYYQAIKKSEFVSILVGWMNLEAVIQNEISQKGKKKRHTKLMYVYIYVYTHTHMETQEEGDICIIMFDLHYCTAETNIIL